MTIAKRVQQMLRSLGLNVTRLPGNRFDAMRDVLERLAREGFRPTLIVDVGSNLGQWASTASNVYPDVPLHMIEPQTICRPALDAFAARRGRAHVHGVVVSRPEVTHVLMVDAQLGSTGAHVIPNTAGRTDGVRFDTSTLDRLIGPSIGDGDRILLKVDVEGHELDVLAGASHVLRRVEVIVSEVEFFDVADEGHTTFLAYATALHALGFELYDFAGLASRRRDGRLRMGDAIFVREGTALVSDNRWA
jgi:FkbM family methyltransferase